MCAQVGASVTGDWSFVMAKSGSVKIMGTKNNQRKRKKWKQITELLQWNWRYQCDFSFQHLESLELNIEVSGVSVCTCVCSAHAAWPSSECLEAPFQQQRAFPA